LTSATFADRVDLLGQLFEVFLQVERRRPVLVGRGREHVHAFKIDAGRFEARPQGVVGAVLGGQQQQAAGRSAALAVGPVVACRDTGDPVET